MSSIWRLCMEPSKQILPPWCVCICRILLCDLFSTQHERCGWPLDSAMQRIAEEDSGVIVVLRNHDSSREIIQRMRRNTV